MLTIFKKKNTLKFGKNNAWKFGIKHSFELGSFGKHFGLSLDFLIVFYIIAMTII